MRKVRIFGGLATKSFSLREENAEVSPTYFEWAEEVDNPSPVFFADGHLSDVTEWWRFSKKIGLLVESPCLHPENYQAAALHHDSFDVILTYDKNTLDTLPNARFYPFGGSSIAFDKWGIYPKSKDVCMFLSDKKTTEGHKLRHKIAEEFGDRIDVYSNFDSKFEILKDYRYCVVVESCDTEQYFSEKLIDPLTVGTYPIYWGSNYGVHDYFNLICECILHFPVYEDDMRFFVRALEWATEKKYEIGGLPYVFDTVEKYLRNVAIMEDWIFEHYPDLFEE